MRKSLALILLGSLLISGQTFGQNIYEIICSAYARGKSLKDVNFKLMQGENQLVDVTSKTGEFQFAIKQGDGQYSLEISKTGYISKKIYFAPDTYPFENEYEIQEIDLEFITSTDASTPAQEGELKWSSLMDEFSVVRVEPKVMAAVDDMEENKGDEEESEQSNDDSTAVSTDESGADKEMKSFSSSVTNSGIPSEMLDKINKGEIKTVEDPMKVSGILYSIQLGAFAKQVDKAKFANVPDFKAIQYADFTRCFSGEFEDINDAIARRKEIVAAGYKDAWIVKMKGNERIGF